MASTVSSRACFIPWTTSCFVILPLPPVGQGALPLEAGLHVIIGAVIFILIQLAVYMLVYFRMVRRTERVERYLPDVLQLVAANVRAGMTPFQALKFAARDEFGDIKDEIEYATTKALGTGSFSVALRRMRERIKSKILERVIQLFVSSMKSGAHLAKVLEDIAQDISETRSLKRELVTNTKTYSMFILFTVLLGTPFMLSISNKFLGIISEMQAKSAGKGTGFGMGFLMGEIQITPEFIGLISITMSLVTSLSAGILMGVIKEGSMKYGLKYFPILAVLTQLALLGSQYFLEISGLF